MSSKILSYDAKLFLDTLHTTFEERIQKLLLLRQKRKGEVPSQITYASTDDDSWKVLPPPKEIEDRRVEITGPPARKMIINGLNSGANVFMADFEDSNSPTWKNCLEGQLNLYDAVRKKIDFTDPETKKSYKLNKKTATLFVRPRVSIW